MIRCYNVELCKNSRSQTITYFFFYCIRTCFFKVDLNYMDYTVSAQQLVIIKSLISMISNDRLPLQKCTDVIRQHYSHASSSVNLYLNHSCI